MTKPTVIFVLGGPGAGKGTQCKLISDRYGYVHLSAGDLLREERERPGSEFGETIDSFYREGNIVPVEITCSLLKRAMKENGWSNSKFLIDGFPRNLDNLQGWQKMVGDEANVSMCLVFECPESEMEKRLLARSATSGRSDDNLACIRKRFKVYIESTMPIIEFFRNQGKARVVHGEKPVAEVWKEVQSIFSQ